MSSWSSVVFGPFVETWHRLRRWNPKHLLWNSKSVNFINIHYLYIMGATITCSILLYPIRNMAYIDALFFGSGSATQSGLNTVDINNITLYQQIILMVFGMLCNPIVINSCVVFVRLYWFERKFAQIVETAKLQRRTISRTRSRMRPTGSLDSRMTGDEERNMRGRMLSADDVKDARSPASYFGDMKSAPVDEAELLAHRDIQFGDLPHPTREAMERSPEEHIRFLEGQRSRKHQNGPTLRIPGPREYDLGQVPQPLNEEEEQLGLNHPPTAPMVHRPSWGLHRPSSRRGRSNNSRASDAKRSMDGQEQHPSPDSQHAISSTSFFGFRKPVTLEKIRTAVDSVRRWRTNLEHDDPHEPAPYLSWNPTLGRNSAFAGLNPGQREELGGIEYRALKTLAWILTVYFWAWHIIGWITFTPWIMKSDYYGLEVVEGTAGQGRPWWGIFTSTSHFNDVGYTITADSMNSFNEATFPLLFGSFLIIIGNTGFPIMLRFTIWVLWKLCPVGSGLWEELHFLLDHPRRCFTLLFPSKATWWLFWILVGLNCTDLVFFIVLDINDPTVTAIPAGYRVLDGWYQAASTRTAGFSVINLANLHPAIQVSYMVMMYISVLPIAISMRRTNVYEENSLGIYASVAEEDPSAPEGSSDAEPSYVSAHLRRQLSFDLWFIFLGLFIIAIAEGPRIEDPNDPSFSLFSVLFEIISAYGTVGLSLGYPNINASFSTEFGVVSKLVIIAMQIRGRHRGLPYGLDKAILLPSEKQMEKEANDAERRFLMRRKTSQLGGVSGAGLAAPSNLAGHAALLNGSTTGLRKSASDDDGLGQRMRAIKEETATDASHLNGPVGGA